MPTDPKNKSLPVRIREVIGFRDRLNLVGLLADVKSTDPAACSSVAAALRLAIANKMQPLFDEAIVRLPTRFETASGGSGIGVLLHKERLNAQRVIGALLIVAGIGAIAL